MKVGGVITMTQPQQPVALPHEWDNRDPSETWIWIGNIESNIRIEVSPFQLYINVIENNVEDPIKQQELIEKFRDLHKQVEEVNNQE